eukprot:TRINITY_DN3310_c0_g3_i1.p1 TRINITY_DN3310_c0_g3~~TRINITY_DN3310_c0_g3_i1.p1  ORF type:complete len:418 (+),score=132.72 TRINITY_DN3310_c0_g3_i1:41-1294(+)
MTESLKIGDSISFFSASEEESYEGTIAKIEPKVRLWLKACTNVPSGTRLKSLVPFFLRDVKDLKVLERSKTDEPGSSAAAVICRNMEPQFKSFSSNTWDNDPSSHLSKLKELKLSEVVGSSSSKEILTCLSGDIPAPELYPEGPLEDHHARSLRRIRDLLWEEKGRPPLLSYVPVSYFVISNHCSKTYDKALDELLSQRMVGLSLEGRCLGREGTGSLLCLSTPEGKVFLFDILDQGEEFFKGIRELLVSVSILKVVHDCRMMSDYLDKVLGIRPQNIYDTLGAHISFLTWAVHEGQVINYALSVGHLAQIYLGIAPSSLFYPKYRRDHMDKDTTHWIERPLLTVCKDSAIKNVMFLLDLYVILQEAVALPALRASKALLSVVRDCPDETFHLQRKNPHLLPQKIAFEVLPKWRRLL